MMFPLVILQISSFLAQILPKKLYKCLKWFLHKITRKTEIQRLIELDHIPRAVKVLSLENSLKNSKFPSLFGIQNSVSDLHEDLAKVIIRLKHLPYEANDQRLLSVLRTIIKFNVLKDSVSDLKTTSYDNEKDEDMLKVLWRFAFNELDYERVTSKWKDVGFQGNDPATDFRGMGLLGLIQLTYLVKNYKNQAYQIFSRSNHPQFGFPFAVAAINVTALCVRALDDSSLKTHMYNCDDITTDEFHNFFCYAYSEFSAYYFSRQPENLLVFNTLLTDYEKSLCNRLKNIGDTKLSFN